MGRQFQGPNWHKETLIVVALTFAVLVSGPRLAAQTVHGHGTTNTIPLWTGARTVGNSALTQNGGNLRTGGSISAASFGGDGSALTNVNARGNNNTVTGQALFNFNFLRGSGNTANGAGSLGDLSSGSNNTAIGVNSLDALNFGSSNTAIGANAGINLNSRESNNIDINNAGVAGDSGIIRIGTSGTQKATYIAGIHDTTTGSTTTSMVLVDNNGQLGTVASSRRYKEDIHDMGTASDGLLRLRPVTFRYKKPYADGSKPIQYGLVAEEVLGVYPDLVARDKDGQPETVQYYKLDAMLLNEVQKLAKLHVADQAEITKLRSEVAGQRKQAQEQQAAMKQLQAQVRAIRVTLARGGPADGKGHLRAALAPEETNTVLKGRRSTTEAQKN